MNDCKVVVALLATKPYMSKKELAEMLDLSTRTIGTIIKGLEDGIESGRYHPIVIAGHRYNTYAILDQMKYRDALANKNMRKYVPPFDPTGIAEACGSHLKVVEA